MGWLSLSSFYRRKNCTAKNSVDLLQVTWVLSAAVGGCQVAEPRFSGLRPYEVALLSAVADQTWSGHVNHTGSNSLLHFMLGLRDTGQFLRDS